MVSTSDAQFHITILERILVCWFYTDPQIAPLFFLWFKKMGTVYNLVLLPVQVLVLYVYCTVYFNYVLHLVPKNKYVPLAHHKILLSSQQQQTNMAMNNTIITMEDS